MKRIIVVFSTAALGLGIAGGLSRVHAQTRTPEIHRLIKHGVVIASASCQWRMTCYQDCWRYVCSHPPQSPKRHK